MSLPQSAPKRVGRYRLLAPIARGGAATVYLGRSEGIGGFARIVAVKLLHPHLLDDATSQAANEFLEEAKLAARMQHPMIVPVIDVGRSDEGFFLVMDYVDGASLSEITTHETKLPQRVALRILSDALQGLGAAHSARDEKGRHLGIVHRDFSPQNILVGADGRSRITDFGIARATTRAEYTRTGLVKGKVAYMSPEQAEGKSLDTRSDIWAAGVVTWEVFAGRRMYPKLDPVPMMLRIINDKPPSLKKANPEVVEALDGVVARALCHNPEGRYETAEEMREALLDAVGGPDAMATQAEVGQFVADLRIERLATLRAIVQEASESRTLTTASPLEVIESNRLAETGHQLAIESGTFATTSAEKRVPGATAQMERMLRRRKSGRLLWAMALVAATMAAYTVWQSNRVEPTASRDQKPPPLPQASPPTQAPVAPAAKPDDAQKAETVQDQTRKEITVEAGEPFVSLRIGKRAIVLPSPTESATIRLKEEEQQALLGIEGVTSDGRKATQKLGTQDDAVTLEFPKKRPSIPRRPPRKPAEKKASDLAASPY